MSTLQLLESDLTLRAECGCSMRRAGPVDPESGLVRGTTQHTLCRLHGAAGELLAAGRLGGVVEAMCEVADTEGMTHETIVPIWPRDSDPRFFPQLTVWHVRALQAAIDKAQPAPVTVQATRVPPAQQERETGK